MSSDGQLAGNTNLQKQDLAHLDISKLTPLSPEVISRQATINIGTIGHVAHGKSTVVKAISGVHTVRFKNELERNITIKLERIPDDTIHLLTSSPQMLREFIQVQNRKRMKLSPFKKNPSSIKKNSLNIISTKKRKRSGAFSPDSKYKQLTILDFIERAKRPKIDSTTSPITIKKINNDDENQLENSHEKCEEDGDSCVEQIMQPQKQPQKLAHDENISHDHSLSDCESNCSSVISNIKRLSELVGQSRRSLVKPNSETKKDHDSNEYIVERIIKMNEIDSQPHFFIKWKGYAASANTWEPLDNLKQCHLLAKFLRDVTSQYYETVTELAITFENKNVRPINVMDAFKLIEKFDEYQLESDICLLAMLKQSNDADQTTYAIIKKRIEANLDLLPFYVKRQEQLEELSKWEALINSTDKSSNLTVTNNVDFEGPPDDFQYINDNVCGEGVTIPDDPMIGCECGDVCYSRNQCCGKNSGSVFAYNDKKRIKVPPGTPIFECNKRCKCGPKCMNRVVQQGRKHSLQIFKTDNGRGWGVRTERTIYEGQFISEYVGEIITYEETERRGQIYDAQGRTYLFDLDVNSSDNPYTIDAGHMGNVSHFLNHSCAPNCGVWAVWINCLDMDLPKICLFALRRIEAGEELCFDYLNSEANDANDVTGSSSSCSETLHTQATHKNDEPKPSKFALKYSDNMKCKCNSENCRKYIF